MNEQAYLCPHCNNRTKITIVKRIESIEKREVWEGTIVPFEILYKVGQCYTCKSLLLFVVDRQDEDTENLNNNRRLYPVRKGIPNHLPELLRQNYIEALKVKKSSPNAFAVLIRKALEYLCVDQKAKGNNLYEKLLDLFNNNVIPRNLSDMSEVLRLLGNAGAHIDGKHSLTLEDAYIIDDFFNVIIEYVYIAPRKLFEYKERLSKRPKVSKN